MNSISPECQQLKDDYDKCFNIWFSDKFLKGSKTDDCAGLFKTYQTCVKKALADKGINVEQVEKDVMGTDKEKTPPDESGKKWLK